MTKEVKSICNNDFCRGYLKDIYAESLSVS